MSEWFEREFLEQLKKLTCEVNLIRQVLAGPEAKLQHVEVEVMPKIIDVGKTATATILGFDQFGKPFAIPSTESVSLAASVPADVSFGTPTFNADGSVSVVLTGVNADPSDSITATVGTVVSSADVLTINAAAPVLTTATLTLS